MFYPTMHSENWQTSLACLVKRTKGYILNISARRLSMHLALGNVPTQVAVLETTGIISFPVNKNWDSPVKWQDTALEAWVLFINQCIRKSLAWMNTYSSTWKYIYTFETQHSYIFLSCALNINLKSRKEQDKSKKFSPLLVACILSFFFANSLL